VSLSLFKPYYADERYLNQGVIGSGGMAIVLRVLDQNLGVERALKLLSNALQESDEARQRHEREARLAAQLEHPNVVAVHDFFEDDGQLCTIMSLARGSVVDWVQAHGAPPPRLAVKGSLALLDALAKAHAIGIIHRDIKPHNILLNEAGALQLADFGIAQLKGPDRDLTHTGATLGSLAFMAPEQRKDSREVDSRADIFSMAGTLVWMLTLRPPLDLQLPNERLSVLEAIPEPLRDVLTKATQTDPDARYESAEEFGAALSGCLHALDESDATFANFERQSAFGAFHTIPPGPVTSRVSVGAQSAAPSDSYRGLSLTLAGLVTLTLFALLALFMQPSTDTDSQVAAVPSAYSLPACEGALTFETRPQRKLGGRETLGSLLHDIDADGHLDALFVQQLDANFTLYWGDERGVLGEGTTYPVSRTDSYPALGDLNADGRSDLVFVSADSSEVSVLLGETNRGFKALPPLFQDQRPDDPVLFDLNNDGQLDLAFRGVEGVSWRRGDGAGGFGGHDILCGPTDAFTFSRRDNALTMYVAMNGQLLRYGLEGELHVTTREVLMTFPPREIAPSPYDRYQLRIDTSSDNSESLWAWEHPRAEWILRISAHESDAPACRLAAFERQRIGGLGDWSGDGVLDLVSHRTCSFCTSNQEIRLGQTIKTPDDSAQPTP
jgi:serine/threonine protein kinase